MIETAREKYMNHPVIGAVMYMARNAHNHINQTYDGKPYFDEHVMSVYEFGLKYLHLIPEQFRVRILCAILLHDVLEDCPSVYTYNDLRKAVQSILWKFGKFAEQEDAFDEANEIVEIVWGVTNNAGRSRDERADDEFYERLNQRWFPPFVKLADRLANANASRQKGRGMSEVHMSEYKHFRGKVYNNINLCEMVHELDIMLMKDADRAKLEWGTLVLNTEDKTIYAVKKTEIADNNDGFEVTVTCVPAYNQGHIFETRPESTFSLNKLRKHW